MGKKIVISGIGLISAIGDNKEETLQALLNGKSGLGELKNINSVHRKDVIAGEIPYSDSKLFELAGLPFKKAHTRTSLYGIIAVKEALKQAGLSQKEISDAALVSATTVGGMSKSELHYQDFLRECPNMEFIDTHDCGDSTEKIADTYRIKGHLNTLNTACSSSANAIIYAANLILNDQTKIAIAGGTDSLSKFTINGFRTLKIMDRHHCKPFDKDRNGLNLGEAAAFLVLESEENAKKHKRKPLAEVKGWGNANDAFHQTALSPEGKGAFLAMEKALGRGMIRPQDVDYINAHGTATINNDISEGLAIEKLFGENIPLTGSTKSYTGHTLGACGALEAAFCVMAINNNIVFPNLNLHTVDPQLHFEPARTLIRGRKIVNVLSNAFGFGGNNSSLLFSAI